MSATMARQGQIRPSTVSDKEWAEACSIAAQLMVTSDLPARQAIKEGLRMGWRSNGKA